ncbi:MAG: branched-chain amino acid ABC transporter permease [Rhodospirillaceae bacterium]|nr:branched-chain amino acid ABC transporter permease [Rhodospirillaceae bacterium]MBT5194482.1 branched-chain amino acid ABC transporter permease [Rhodospirillaceae bacterium]MBT5894438.1 branched-chain amino acid ABC transporter permease [Rhodospirillaceae bacterium]MBT6429341.1 branched-chain amino acid ABC transporter permease [Rhodospirillaceae bacterium]MBT7758386.1 branched-chain amino acid ABC transporter permease [Rhodospirillaceae bacterium]
MNGRLRPILMFAAMAAALATVGIVQSWSLSLAILNLCLISAVMSLGVNIQWGYAGLFNVGVMGFAALGGVTGVLISTPPVMTAWQAGGNGIIISFFIALATILAAIFVVKRMAGNRLKRPLFIAVIVAGYFLARYFFDPAVENIEAVEPAKTGYLGGFGLPIIFSWIAGGLLAAGAAWVVGKIALGLRSDYLAIATLGISEIIVAALKNEDWLTRGVKNVSGLPRPVPYEIDLQQTVWFQEWAAILGATPVEFSSIFVKLCYGGLFAVVLLAVLWLSERALNSPWGRMMRAIRDNEVSAEAMGKDVTGRHLQVFILGSAVIGIAGAMLTTLDGQFTPSSYQPLRFTFIIWVMVIVGGSGNNWGAVLGGFVIWFFWIEAEPMGLWLMDLITAGMADDSGLRKHLLNSAAHMRLMTMGLILLLVLRFSPRGLIPEK